ncbi:MAG: PQQ-dependent sugar dehydrogenase [Flavobacterium sp.]|nr:PQQ-dependent sugar dehydrogenase [Flavobacterium sp.]
MKKLLLIFMLSLAIQSQSQTNINIGSTTVEVETIYTGLDIPWEIIYGPDGYIWTTERKGIISRIDPVAQTKTVILNIVSSVYQNSESGMLGMALHPNFAANPEVFVAYTYGTFSNLKEKLVKYTYNGTSLVNPVVILDNIIGNTTHNGSRLLILPDNTLLFSTGDAQNQLFPQDITELNGKLLRINLDGTIPADNPIAGNPVYSFGHRNVQGLLLHPNGKIYMSEHGASTDDEFQIAESGRNFGWPNVEGFCNTSNEQSFCTANNVKEPLLAWTPTIAPSDLVYYENAAFPEFNNKVLMTVLKDKKLIAMQLDATGNSVLSQTHYLTNLYGRLRDICVGAQKEIYLATNGASWSNTNPNTHSIIVLRPPNDLGIDDQFKAAISVYPNPIGNEFTINFTDNVLGNQFCLTDLTGRTIFSSLITEKVVRFNSTELKNGIYVLQVTMKNGTELTKKLIK